MDQTDTPTKKVPLWKQLAGAGTGALIALAFYGVYEVASPVLSAYLSIPSFRGIHSAADVRVQSPSNTETQERLARRAREIAEQFSERPITDLEEDVPEEYIEPAAAPAAEPVTPVEAKEEITPTPLADVETPLYEKAQAAENIAPPSLPSSGFGLWLSIHVALLAVIGIRYRTKIYKKLRWPSYSVKGF